LPLHSAGARAGLARPRRTSGCLRRAVRGPASRRFALSWSCDQRSAVSPRRFRRSSSSRAFAASSSASIRASSIAWRKSRSIATRSHRGPRPRPRPRARARSVSTRLRPPTHRPRPSRGQQVSARRLQMATRPSPRSVAIAMAREETETRRRHPVGLGVFGVREPVERRRRAVEDPQDRLADASRACRLATAAPAQRLGLEHVHAGRIDAGAHQPQAQALRFCASAEATASKGPATAWRRR